MEKKKISIFVLHLGYGGIEKAVSILANMLCDNYFVEIISIYKLYEKPAFNIGNNVNVIYLSDLAPNKKEFLNAIKKVNIIRTFKEGIKAVKILILKKILFKNAVKTCESDILISTRYTFNKYMKKYKKDKILISWEHMHHNNNKKFINNLVKSVNGFNYLIPVSKSLTRFYSDKVKNVNCKYLPLCIENIPEEQSKLDKKQITLIGRLSEEKGILDLIDVFRLANEKDNDIILNIVGDGLQKEEIIKKIKSLNLQEKVVLHGYLDKYSIEKILLNTSIYIMTSYFESFGLVILEAMSYGIPCIAFDTAEGPREIVEDGVDGYVVKNRNKAMMADKIIELLNNKELLHKLELNAKNKAMQFSYENSKEKWIEFIGNIIEE